MKKSMVPALVLALALCGAPAAAQSAAAEVRDVVEELFRRMKAGDADGMAALLHDDARLVTTGVRDGRPTARPVPVQGWLDGVRGSERELDERLYDTTVHVSQGLAVVWTGYDLFVDGALSHCGFDAFQLVRLPEGWRIIEIADTRRQEACRGS